MSARYHHIIERSRPSELAPVTPEDFVLRDGPAVDAGIVLTDPTLSLYCFDSDQQRALFVETPPTVDLSAAPFMYAAQFEHATRLLSVPNRELHALADAVQVDDTQITFIHSTARCGSTAVSAAFNAAAATVSLSEPDLFFAMGRERSGHDGDDVARRAMLHSAVKLLCRPTPQVAAPHAWVIKFRAQDFMLADLIDAAFPHAHTIYLYRNADTWLRSILRMGQRQVEDFGHGQLQPHMLQMLEAMAPLLPAYFADPHTPKSAGAVMTVMWLSSLDQYLHFHAEGMSMLAGRYEQLRADPHAFMARLFDHAGVVLGDTAQLETALRHDSQSGTSMARLAQADVEPDVAMLADMQAAIDWHPVIDRADFVVPGTMNLPSA